MRYPASEKLEIIRLVMESHLSVRRMLQQIGIPRATFYRWCDLYQTGGPDTALRTLKRTLSSIEFSEVVTVAPQLPTWLAQAIGKVAYD